MSPGPQRPTSLPSVPPPYAVPSRTDRVVATAARAIGGPAGRHLAIGTRGLAGVAAALVVMSAVMMALAVWQKGHCLMKGWSNPGQFWRTCYSDVPVVHVTTGLAEGSLPYAGATPSDQPPLSGLLLWVLARVSPASGTGLASQQWVFGLWAGLATVLLALAVLAAVSLRPHHPWQAAHLAASPVLVVLALVSTDLLGIALVVWALVAWRSGRPVPAGVLLGVALLLRPHPLVFVAVLALLAWRDGRARAAAHVVLAAVLTFLAVYVPFALAVPGVQHGLRSWLTSGPSYGATTLVPQLLPHLGLRPLLPVATTVVALAGWALALALGWWLSRSRWRPGLVPLAGAMLLVVALTAKAVPVQAGLWLLPLLALSRVPWRDHLVWAGVEIVHFVMVWMHIGFGFDAGRGLPGSTYALFLGLRLAAWAWLVWRLWQTTPAQGTSSSLPVVPPDSRSEWARAASTSG